MKKLLLIAIAAIVLLMALTSLGQLKSQLMRNSLLSMV